MLLARVASPRYGCNVGADVIPARQGRDTVGLRSYLRRVRYGEMQKGQQLNFASLFPNRLALALPSALSSTLRTFLFLRPFPPTHTLRTRPCYPSHSMIYNQRRSSCKQERPRYLRFCPHPAANLRLLPGASSLKIHRAVSLFQSYAKTLAQLATKCYKREVCRRHS